MIGLEKLRIGMRDSALATLRLVTRLAPSNHADYPSAALATALILSKQQPGQHLRSSLGLPPHLGTDSLGLVWLDGSSASAERYVEAAERVRRECTAEQGARDRDAKLLRDEVRCPTASFRIHAAILGRMHVLTTFRPQLEALQNPQSCESSRVLVYTLTGVSDGVGIGCELHLMAVALSTAYSLNKTLVLDPAVQW